MSREAGSARVATDDELVEVVVACRQIMFLSSVSSEAFDVLDASETIGAMPDDWFYEADGTIEVCYEA